MLRPKSQARLGQRLSSNRLSLVEGAELNREVALALLRAVGLSAVVGTDGLQAVG